MLVTLQEETDIDVLEVKNLVGFREVSAAEHLRRQLGVPRLRREQPLRVTKEPHKKQRKQFHEERQNMSSDLEFLEVGTINSLTLRKPNRDYH